jgi:DNA (cytosine-5)-methyltransferase 1
MRFVSLFSGIGGLDLGLERAGMRCVAQVENNPWCQQILEKHWPDVPRWGDIQDVNPEELPEHDLICGGFPCQPVSVAGERLGTKDPRWLWPEFFRIVRTVRPRYVLVENVLGLLSAGFGELAGDLASIGYDTQWQSISAAAIGAPHQRRRVFLVAYPNLKRFTGSPSSATEPAQPFRSSSNTGEQWAVEPGMGRVAYGIPRRVDRLRALGNAVVPQVAELVGNMLMDTGQLSNIHLYQHKLRIPQKRPQKTKKVQGKICSECNQWTAYTDMSKDKRREDRMAGQCKACKAKKDWRKNPAAPKPPDTTRTTLTVLSLGAGVQSSTLLMMSELEELPRLDFAVFADTGWEPQTVYDNLDWLERNTTIPIVRVNNGTLLDNPLDMPLFTPNGGMLNRQCTRRYKIQPIRRIFKEQLRGKFSSHLIHLWLGISYDESHRMADSDARYIQHHYPLIEKEMTRADCLTWMSEQGFPEPPRSSCIGCPYHSDEEWNRLTPSEWGHAIQVERTIHLADANAYLHSARTPLEHVTLKNDEGTWGNECSGMCGV